MSLISLRAAPRDRRALIQLKALCLHAVDWALLLEIARLPFWATLGLYASFAGHRDFLLAQNASIAKHGK